jgi:hypothetical protein
MQRYRVTGAYRDSGHDFVGEFVALNEADCRRQAAEIGVLVSTVEPIDIVAAPQTQSRARPTRKRKSEPQFAWRAIVRWIAMANAIMLMVPGVVCLLTTLLLSIASFAAWVDSLSKENEQSVQVLGLPITGFILASGLVYSLILLLASALLFLLLYIEDHLFILRKRP